MSVFNRDSMLLSRGNPGAESRFEHENRRMTEVKREKAIPAPRWDLPSSSVDRQMSKIDQELTAAKFRIAEAMNTDSSMEAIMDIEMATKYLHAALILAREEMK